jgi:hypothetical protein
MKILEQSPRIPISKLKIGDDFLPMSYLRTENTPVEAEPKPDILAKLAQPNFKEEIPFFTEEDEAPVLFKLDPTEKPERPPIELQPLPPGLKYVFLHGNRETPVIISDKLSEVETQQLITVPETHRSVLGYSLQDLKVISPTLCTHRIPIDLTQPLQENFNVGSTTTCGGREKGSLKTPSCRNYLPSTNSE